MSEEPFPWVVVVMAVTAVLIIAMVLLSRRSQPKAIWGRLCSACGMYMPSFARFCPHCGRRADGPSQK
jgi:predicted amidophosphoribosyltransferase